MDLFPDWDEIPQMAKVIHLFLFLISCTIIVWL